MLAKRKIPTEISQFTIWGDVKPNPHWVITEKVLLLQEDRRKAEVLRKWVHQPKEECNCELFKDTRTLFQLALKVTSPKMW